MIKLKDIESGDILEVDVTDLGEEYERLKNHKKAYFRVSLVSDGEIVGTFNSDDRFFKGRVSIDNVIKKSNSISWIDSVMG
jgi:hypothetical protein